MFRTTLIFWLLPRHLRWSWVMLSIVFVGVLAAVTLMSIGAIYSRALAEGGLQHAIATTAPTILDVRLTIQNRPLGPADYVSLRAAVVDQAGRLQLPQEFLCVARSARLIAIDLATLP